MHRLSDGLIAAITPTVDTNAYASGDVISTPQKISNAVLNTKGVSVLRTISVVDLSNQKSALDLLFFNDSPGTMGADNAALDISTAQLAMFIGRVSIATGDYTTLKANTNAEATHFLEMLIPAKQKLRDIWMQIVSRGSPTYAAASNLTVNLIFERIS